MTKRFGFTLAEVLITLGIIGVVAALTLPTLIVNYQKKVAAKRLSQTYNQLYQAINHAQADYGDISGWDIGFDKSLEEDNDLGKVFADKYILPYLQLSSPSVRASLKDKGYSGYKSKDGRNYFSDVSAPYIAELSNGVTLFFGMNSNGTAYTYPLIYVDINGPVKPNTLGRDFFGFELDAVNAMRLKPFGYGVSRDGLLSDCAKNVSAEAWRNLYCTGLIMSDGWEIKDDYPW